MQRCLQHLLLASIVIFSLCGTAAAQPIAGNCLIGPQLGASLLFPYFEVEFEDPTGATTLIAINNGTADPTLARVILWSDWGNPILSFDLYLGRFDIVTINLRDVLNGNIPSTGEGANLAAFPFCNTVPPYHPNPTLDAGQQAALKSLLSGKAVQGAPNVCYGENHGDGRARGYVTVDASRECGGAYVASGFLTPESVSYPYFGDGVTNGIATYRNVLYGDMVFIDPSENLTDGSEAVVLWADTTRFSPGPVFTFYGRFSAWDGRDKRVPLPSTWNMRFLNGGPFAGGAAAIVYHDPGSPVVGGSTCGGARPSPLPLAGLFSVTDEDGHTVDGVGALPMQLVTRKTRMNELSLPYIAGFLQLSAGVEQMWVQTVLSANTRFSLGFNATPVSFLCGRTPLGR